MTHCHYHIDYFEPTDPWPRGGWSVCHINGDEIADRVVRAEVVVPDNGPAYYRGPVIARHSWCGYIGTFETLEEVTIAIREDKDKRAAEETKQRARQRRK